MVWCNVCQYGLRVHYTLLIQFVVCMSDLAGMEPHIGTSRVTKGNGTPLYDRHQDLLVQGRFQGQCKLRDVLCLEKPGSGERIGIPAVAPSVRIPFHDGHVERTILPILPDFAY